MKNKFIGEGGRLISDILEVSESLNLKCYIVTVDIEKAFDSLSHFLKNMDMEMTLLNRLKCYLNAKSLALSMEVMQQNILNFKKVLDKAIQFPRTYLTYVLKLYSF